MKELRVSRFGRSSEIENAIWAEIHVRIGENPAFYTSLKEWLEKIIEDRKALRIEQAKQLERLEALIKEVKKEASLGTSLLSRLAHTPHVPRKRRLFGC